MYRERTEREEEEAEPLQSPATTKPSSVGGSVADRRSLTSTPTSNINGNGWVQGMIKDFIEALRPLR